MDREQVIAVLRGHEMELRAAEERRSRGSSCLLKILSNVIFIEEFTKGLDLEDLKTRNATERCIERISEAARKLGQVAEDLSPDVPWPMCGRCETSCATNMTELTRLAFG